jgi:hypothetical protein
MKIICPLYRHGRSTRRVYRCELRFNQEYYKNCYCDALRDSLKLSRRMVALFGNAGVLNLTVAQLNFLSVALLKMYWFEINFMTIFAVLLHRIIQIWTPRYTTTLTVAMHNICCH